MVSVFSFGCPEGPSAPDAAAVVTTALAKLTVSSGHVTLTRSNHASPAQPADLILGDVIETGADGDATIRFRDGHEIQLGPDGRFEIENGDEGLVLNVGQGVVVSRVVGDLVNDDSMHLAISTPFGLIRLGANEFRLNVGGEDANLQVLVGNVQIVSRNGELVTFSAGDVRLGREGASRVVRLEPLHIELNAIVGRVELKKSDAKIFTPINPKQLPELDQGDALRVGRGSATVQTKGSVAKLTVSSNSEVGIGEAQGAAGLEDVALELKKGGMNVNMPLGAKRTLRPGDGYTLSVNNGAQFSVARSKTGLEINTVVGEIVIEHDSMESVTVRGSQISKLSSKGGVKVIDLPREPLLIPARTGLKVFHPGVAQAALNWPGEAGKVYRVMVANEPTFANPTIDGTVQVPWLNVNLPAHGSLYWRVLAGETEVGKGSLSCAPERAAASELQRVRNEVPDGAEKTVIYYQDKPPSVTFLWREPDPKPAEYRLQVYREGALHKAIEERLAKSTTLQLPENALSEGNYLWSVTPLDANGQALAGGRMNKLEMIYDNAVAELVIKSPRNGDPVSASVPVVGIAPLRTRVTANGQVLSLDEKARFNSKVAPLNGRFVVFRTSGEAGEQLIVRVLRRAQ